MITCKLWTGREGDRLSLLGDDDPAEGFGLLNQVSVEVGTFFSLAFECSLHSFIHVYFLPVLNDQHLKYQQDLVSEIFSFALTLFLLYSHLLVCIAHIFLWNFWICENPAQV